MGDVGFLSWETYQGIQCMYISFFMDVIPVHSTFIPYACEVTYPQDNGIHYAWGGWVGWGCNTVEVTYLPRK